jgi:hypothetical protein
VGLGDENMNTNEEQLLEKIYYLEERIEALEAMTEDYLAWVRA